MSKLKNPAIKLFGKTISLPPNQAAAADYHHHPEQELSSSASTEDKSTSEEDFVGGMKDHDLANPTEDESVERETTSTGSETLKTPAASSELSPKDTIRDEQTESSVSIEMTMKKPEKILQCPRCSSMDTKFCYYNNYNVKQPRHFCKSCQRFWTAGGTMRNVAVGSGRRKNKGNCPSSPDLTKRPELLHSAQGYGPRIYCFSEGAWNSQGNSVRFSSPASQDATFPSSFAVNFYPANPYYISAVPGPWRPPSLPCPNQSMTSTNPNSPLGKHLRDGSLMQSNLNVGEPAPESGTPRYVMPNKAMKIDGSIRSIKEGNEDSFNGSCHFMAFYPILDGKNHVADNSVILQANPAAFSRSMNFHERS